MSLLNFNEWDEWQQNKTNVHLLQSSAWAKFKEKFGWTSIRVVNKNCGAQILFKKLPLGFKIAYIPKGPVGEPNELFLNDLDIIVKKNHSIFMKIEPDTWEDSSKNLWLQNQKLISSKTIQPRRSIIIDLSGGELDWLGNMKQKTRYNIRLAQKKDIVVKESNDIRTFYELMQSTGERDGFGIHSMEYYNSVYNGFIENHQVALLLAYYNDIPLAGLMVFRFRHRAWYFYGASNNRERNRMPTYLLQFEAMKWAKKFGCTEYDLWGIPDEDEEILEEEFSDRSDGLWGVYRFKRGFGGIIRRQSCAYDRIYMPILYKLYLKYQNFSGAI